jgi:hypothetical protein
MRKRGEYIESTFEEELREIEPPSWSKTVDVHIRANITKVMDIDTVNQRFQAEAEIESIWHDPNIKSMTDKIDEKTIWTPDIYIDYGVKDVSQEIVYKVLPSTNEIGFSICELRKVRGIFWENLELQDFPLDVQDLSLTITSKKSANCVNFVTSASDEYKEITVNNTLDRSMWQMHDFFCTKKTIEARDFACGPRKFHTLKITTQAIRSPGYYWYNAIVPLFLVTNKL